MKTDQSLCYVYIRFIRKKTSVDKPVLEYMSKKLNTEVDFVGSLELDLSAATRHNIIMSF